MSRKWGGGAAPLLGAAGSPFNAIWPWPYPVAA